MVKPIKLFEPVTNIEEEKTIIKVLRSGFWASGAGKGQVLKFENEFKKKVNTKNCVAVNSGTAALHLALSEVNVQGKEVILPSLSFVSTANAILYNNGIPTFVDVDEKTLCIDPEQIKKKISNKTKVILPVHFGGVPSKMNEIKKIAKDNNCFVIEDAAHACGASYNKKNIGSHGDLVCFSFHPVKNLAMSTGGLISINTDDHLKIRDSLFKKRWCGISNRKDVNYDVEEIGWNYYMNEFSAAIGLVQLKKLDKMNSIRKKIAKRYFKELDIIKKMPFSTNYVYHFYWILVGNREEFRKKMNKHGIETGIHYNPIHKMSLYDKKIRLSITEKISNEIVTLPTHPNLKNNEIDKIIRLANEFAS